MTAPAEGLREDPVRARRYEHPAVAGRPVVRLVGDTAAPGTDVAMAFMGFGEPVVYEPALTAAPRPLGYPGWALVQDPDNATAALTAAKQMRRAIGHTLSAPKTAQALYDKAAADLPIPHLPAYYEQVARDFLDNHGEWWASLYFGKARETEQAHALPVDPAARHESYVEFAVSGAVTAKALKGYATELAETRPGAEALALFTDLAVRRTKAGVAPWTGLPAQIKDLAKKGGIDPGAALADLAKALLPLETTREASTGFWKAMAPVLQKAVKTDAETATLVAELFPAERDWWLPLLSTFDTASAVRDPAVWLKRAHGHFGGMPAELIALIPTFAARLKASGDPLSMPQGVDADFVETLLACGVTMAPPDPKQRLTLSDWRRHTDLASVGAAPEWRHTVHASVEDLLRRGGTARCLEAPVLRPFAIELCREWAVAAHRADGLESMAEKVSLLVTALGQVPLPPELTEDLRSIDPAAALAATVRAGLPVEFAWKALDRALSDDLDSQMLGMSASWPLLTVWNRYKAVALGPDGVVASYTFPAGQDVHSLQVTYADGQFLVRSGYWGSRAAHWSGDPAHTFETSHGGDEWNGDGLQMLNPDGRHFTGEGLLTAGTENGYAVRSRRRVLSDGRRWWTPDGEDGYRLLDPATGTETEETEPQPFPGVPRFDTDRHLPRHSRLAPLPDGVTDSPLGAVDGLVGGAVTVDRETENARPVLTTLDGERFTVPGDTTGIPYAPVTFPGGERMLLALRGGNIELIHPESGTHFWTVTPAKTGIVYPPAAYWHFMAPQCEPESAVLRAMTTAEAQALLDHPQPPEPAEGEEKRNWAAEAVATFTGLTDWSYRTFLASLLRETRAVRLKLDGLLVRPEPEAKPTARLDLPKLTQALDGLVDTSWGYGNYPVAEQLTWVSGVLRGEDSEPDQESWLSPRLRWPSMIGTTASVAWRLASSVWMEDSHRGALLDFLEIWAGTVFADPETVVSVWDVDAYARQEQGSHRPGLVRMGGTAVSVGVTPENVQSSYESGPGWCTAERLRALIALVRERGPVPWDPEAAAVFAARTGVPVATAGWLLATVPAYNGWPRDRDRDKRLRSLLDLKAKRAESSRGDAFALAEEGRLATLCDAALPDDPAELWAQGGVRAFAERMAALFVERFGQRVSVAESTIATMTEYNDDVTELLDRMTAPGTYPMLASDERSTLTGKNGGDLELGSRDGGLQGALHGLVRGILSAYANLPAGDVVFEGVAVLGRLLRERLAAPGLVFAGGRTYADEREVSSLRESMGDRPYRDAAGRHVDDVFDTGPLILAVITDRTYRVFLRPARLGDDPESALARSLATGWRNPVVTVDLVRSEEFGRILDRVSSGALPAGAYEANPAVSAPELVAETSAALGVGTEAATLYLQLLALAEPTDRNVRTWNGWTPARHKKAAAELLTTGRVVEATRARAGRKLFIPGPWTATSSPHLPYETAKAGLYGLSADPEDSDTGPLDRILPLRPLPELFAEAWHRRTEGNR